MFMAENSSIHVDYIEEMISNIKTSIICLIHRVAALISDIGTCSLKRGITVPFSLTCHPGKQRCPIVRIQCGAQQ